MGHQLRIVSFSGALFLYVFLLGKDFGPTVKNTYKKSSLQKNMIRFEIHWVFGSSSFFNSQKKELKNNEPKETQWMNRVYIFHIFYLSFGFLPFISLFPKRAPANPNP